jgi:uncharacterized protein (TIGR03437 family)
MHLGICRFGSVTLGACVLFRALAIAAPPEIARGGVFNQASPAQPGALNSGIAQGAAFTIAGKGLGNAGIVRAEGFPLTTSLGDVAVTITVGATKVDAYVLSVSESQIVALLPSGTPTGDAVLTVAFKGETSAPEALTVVRRNFGVFTLNESGSGPALAHVFNPDTDPPLNPQGDQPVISLIAPARPGQTITLWGTGLGPVMNEANGPAPGDFDPRVTIYVGGIQAKVRYRGRSSCCAGIDQIVFDVPEGVQGCYVSIQVAGAGLLSTQENRTIPLEHTVSNSVTIPVAPDGSPCTDPTGLSGQQLTAMQKGSAARIASISFTRRAPELEEATQDSAVARFSQFEFARFLRSRGIFGLPAKGSCVQYQVGPAEQDSPDPVRAQSLDAGAALSVSGPNGLRELPKGQDGAYASYLGGRNPGGASSPGYLAAGNYTLSGQGGADVGAFEAKFTIPAPLTWTNKSPAALARSFSPTFRWEGGESSGYVIAAAFGRNDLTGFYTVCTAEPSDRTLTIPSYVYAGIVQHTSSAPGIVWIAAGSVSPFEAPGIDFGFINAIVGTESVYIP